MTRKDECYDASLHPRICIDLQSWLHALNSVYVESIAANLKIRLERLVVDRAISLDNDASASAQSITMCRGAARHPPSYQIVEPPAVGLAFLLDNYLPGRAQLVTPPWLVGFTPNPRLPHSVTRRWFPSGLHRSSLPSTRVAVFVSIILSNRLLSKLTIYWLSPLLKVGFTRPLQFEGLLYSATPVILDSLFVLAVDLWQLPSNLLAAPITKRFEAELYSRYPPEERPPTLRHLSSDSAKHDRSLMRAIHAGYWKRIYLAGFMRFIAALTPTLSSFVTRALLNWLTASHNWHNASNTERQQV
jgi:hypothetical protein